MIMKNPRCAFCGGKIAEKRSVIFTTDWTFGGSSRIGWCDECAKKDELAGVLRTDGRALCWEEVVFRVFMRGANRVVVRRTKEWEASPMMPTSSRFVIV